MSATTGLICGARNNTYIFSFNTADSSHLYVWLNQRYEIGGTQGAFKNCSALALSKNTLMIQSANMTWGGQSPSTQPNAIPTTLNYPLILFGQNAVGTKKIYSGTMTVYSLKIYENNVLVRNFIPCYRTKDKEIGLYEKVNRIFYTNAGTGTFTAGPKAH